MKYIKVITPGILIIVDNIPTRSPCTFELEPRTKNQILTQLRKAGAKYEITTLPEKVNIWKDPVLVKEEIIKKPKITYEQFPYNFTYIKDPQDKRDYLYPTKLRTLREVPITVGRVVDYTSEMSPVKDQGRLGSCVGFAVTAMKEWEEQREHEIEISEGKDYRRTQKYYDLSEQWLYYKTKEIDEWPNEEGTSFRYALKILQKQGIPPEKAWPYNDIKIGKPESWATLIARWTKCGNYYRLLSLGDIETAIENDGPCLAGIACFEEIFYVGSNGVIPYPSNPNMCYGGHAVCLVGFDAGKRMFKFKNSWGTSWGENGYGYFNYDYAQDFIWDAWAATDIRVTKEMLKG